MLRAVCTDVDRLTLDQGGLVPCHDVTCQGQRSSEGQEVIKACDVTGSTCVCSRGFVLQGDVCVGMSGRHSQVSFVLSALNFASFMDNSVLH